MIAALPRSLAGGFEAGSAPALRTLQQAIMGWPRRVGGASGPRWTSRWSPRPSPP